MSLPPQAQPGRDWLKLRNSCEACAASKLKCPQEKPTCSRCAKRGLACDYVVAKRGGRKPNNRSTAGGGAGGGGGDGGDGGRESSQAMNATPRQHSTTLDVNANVQTASSISSINEPSTTNSGWMSPPDEMQGCASSDMFHHLFSPLYDSLLGTTGDFDASHDDFFPNSTFQMDLPDVDLSNTADFFPSVFDLLSTGEPETLMEDSMGSEDAGSDLFSLSGYSSLLSHATSVSLEKHNSHDEDRPTVPQSSCSCLVQALGLIKQQFAVSASDACSTWNLQGHDKTSVLPLIQAVIAKNETTIEAVSTILSCSCSQDGSLLVLTSLIVFRVLGWYAVVARKTSSMQNSSTSHCPRQPLSSWEQQQSKQLKSPSPLPQQQQQALHNPTVVDKYCLDGADSARMAAQLILSKLHRVRRLVDQLSAKLKSQGPKNERAGGGMETEITTERIDFQQEMMLPLSTTMYHQMDADLRKQLRTLSSEMIERLRRL